MIFDEAHSEAWTIRPELAGQMQPVHPGDASYARAAELLSEHDFSVAANTAPLDGGVLDGCDLLVIAHPSDPRWESTTGIGSPQLTAAEQDAIHAFVRGGGGLIVLGETEQDKYGNNVNELLERFDLRLRSDTVQDYEHCDGAPTWIHAELVDGGRGSGGDLLAGVERRLLLPRDHDREPQRRPHPGAHAPLGVGARGAADRRLRARRRAASSCWRTRTCSATTASARSITRRCG